MNGNRRLVGWIAAITGVVVAVIMGVAGINDYRERIEERERRIVRLEERCASIEQLKHENESMAAEIALYKDILATIQE